MPRGQLWRPPSPTPTRWPCRHPATLSAANGDAVNDLLIAPIQDQPASRVLADLGATHERLRAAISTLSEDDLGRPAADSQPAKLAGDPDSIAHWIDHICDEHLREHSAWIRDHVQRG